MEDNWIRTEDKLPETRKDILFFVSTHYAGTKAKAGRFVKHYENQYADHGPVFIGDDGSHNPLLTVTHWQELPPPPKPSQP